MPYKNFVRERSVWSGMVRRCTRATDKDFSEYGGRGISVCDRWLTFENFLADMGPRPPGTSIDRINNNGNYEPRNCRWATPTQQARNTRRNVLVVMDGEIICASELADRIGCSKSKAFRAAEGLTDITFRRRGRPSADVTIDGETKTLAEWCLYFGVHRGIVHARIKRGVPIADALKSCDTKQKSPQPAKAS